MEFFEQFLNWRTIAEILILWLVIYQIFLFLKGTKAVYLLRGVIILIVSFFVFQGLRLFVLSKLLTYLFAFFLIFVVVVLQPEIREGLIRLGRRHIFFFEPKREEIEKALKEIVSAVSIFSRKTFKQKTGRHGEFCIRVSNATGS
ncbi:MAG: hypothetical protein KKD55_02470, partial [Candidatus Omnitrophica bacterium]|nr:hypothetical protein [Candidatus Omnitrophota bacterium]